ncbi:MAG: biotin-dependent carboxyltransferase family protein [Holophaga sp.]|nr:biotin-dependent carboxyltransferase family protein [Holophaga sp.]
MSILVDTPGLLSTIQDLGRIGFQHLGVGPAGAMDPVSHRLANLLVGNAPGAATLEITLAGPTLQFQSDTLIALAGADLSPEVEGVPLRMWRPTLVRAGATLAFGAPLQGCRCYLAAAGGFQVPPVMGSASTQAKAGFGGFQGRPLQRGDQLKTGTARELYPALRERFARGGQPSLGLDWFPAWYRELDFLRPASLRVIPGPQWPCLTAAARSAFLEQSFQVAPNSDRMGLRLSGPRLTLERPMEMISSGVATGTVQLPPDGSPILLMADHQTTGGYPRLGELASVDLARAAQLRSLESVRFATITLETAQALLLEREARFRALARVLAERQTY